MRLIKAALMIVMITGSGQAASTSPVTLTINVTFTQPGCDIQAPSSYNLGILPPGSKTHDPLDITWACEGNTPVKTALTASIIAGIPENNNKVVRLLAGPGKSRAALSLREKGEIQTIKLTGPTAGDYFCSDVTESTGMRTCKLLPMTEVSDSGEPGPASATLRFEVGYP